MITIDALTHYLKEVDKKIKVLTPEEELKYSRLAKNGDKEAKQKMIESNLFLVINIGKRYVNKGLDLEDILEEGNMGLMHAVDKFDPEKGFRFSTYAVWWIREHIEKAIMEQTRLISVPVYLIKEFNALYKNKEEDIGEHFTCSANTCLNQHIDNIDDTTYSKTLVETLPDENNVDPLKTLEHENFEKTLKRWLNRLGKNKSDLITNRFGLFNYDTSTLDSIGKKYNLTRERVRQIQRDVLGELKDIASKEGLSPECF